MIRVLFIDDNKDILHVAKLILEPKGFHVDTIDHAEGIELFIQNVKPDIIFLDVHLQRFDGREVCKKLKSNPDMMPLPVILFSSDKIPSGDVAECGADGFMSKPFEIDLLIKNIYLYKKD